MSTPERTGFASEATFQDLARRVKANCEKDGLNGEAVSAWAEAMSLPIEPPGRVIGSLRQPELIDRIVRAETLAVHELSIARQLERIRRALREARGDVLDAVRDAFDLPDDLAFTVDPGRLIVVVEVWP